MDRRVRVEGSDEDLNLGVDTLLLLSVGANDGEGANTLAVKSLDTLVEVKQIISKDLPCSWQKIVPRQHYGPVRRSVSKRRHLYQYLRMQSLGTPYQRKRNALLT
jgi:hypothetical protein